MYLLLILPQIKCFALFVTASDPYEDDACSHVPPADRPGAACLHLTRQKPDLTRPLNVLFLFLFHCSTSSSSDNLERSQKNLFSYFG